MTTVRRIILVLVTFVGLTAVAWLVQSRIQSHDQSVGASLGIPQDVIASASSVKAGELALQDYKKTMNITDAEKNDASSRTLADGLEIRDTVVGTGDEAVAGRGVAVHYTGMLEDGTVFDSSVKRGKPFEFILGKGMVIRGWDEGVVGMKVGGKRVLVIPPALAYGDKGAGGVIPPNATLTFEVELLAVQPVQ